MKIVIVIEKLFRLIVRLKDANVRFKDKKDVIYIYIYIVFLGLFSDDYTGGWKNLSHCECKKRHDEGIGGGSAWNGAALADWLRHFQAWWSVVCDMRVLKMAAYIEVFWVYWSTADSFARLTLSITRWCNL